MNFFRHRRLRAVSLVSAFVLLLITANPPAWGDYECVKGNRDTSPAERGAMQTALETARAAMPGAPEGWVLSGDDTFSVIESMCRDFEEGPLGYGHYREYQRIDDLEERDQILQAAAQGMQADFAAKQSRMDAHSARMQELILQAMEAGQRQDYERVDELNREMEAISGEIEALMAEGDADDNMRAAEAAAGRDRSMFVGIHFNGMHDAPGYEARRWSPAGVPGLVFRWSDTRDGVVEDSALVLIGDWEVDERGGYALVPDRHAGSATPQSITVRVTADAGRLDQVVAGIDFKSLEALLAGNQGRR